MKKLMITVAVMLFSLSFFTGCSKNSGEEAAAGITAADTAKGSEEGRNTAKSLEDADLSDLITLGEYKGLKVTLEDTTVSDDDVKAAENSALSLKKTQEPVTDRAAQEGDTVNIDYEGKKDGVPFSGGTAKGHDLELGSHSFIDGFEDGLVGAKVGETRDLNLTFPEEYHDEALAGQDVVFTVTVNSISANIIPELTDALAKELDPDVSSVKEYREKLKKTLQESKNEAAKAQAYGELLTAVQDKSDIASGDRLPAWLLDQIKADQKENFEASLEMYGIDLDTYLKQQGMTEEDFDETLDAYARSIAAQELVVQALANAENIKVTDEDLKAQYEEDAVSYGYKSGAEFEEAVKKQGAEQTFRDATLTRKVEEMLLSYADIQNPEMKRW
ncbi:MAG: trigger factor [Lachnospiraceae bacterium]|nr:trigger factor [Lachnospiraceae bacterium]